MPHWQSAHFRAAGGGEGEPRGDKNPAKVGVTGRYRACIKATDAGEDVTQTVFRRRWVLHSEDLCAHEMRQLSVCLAMLAVVSGVHGSIFSMGHAGAIARNGKIKFENVLADNDNSWNFRRSQFECSDAGFYYITFHGLARKNSALTLQLFHNKREIVRAYGDGTGYNTASNSAIVYLYNRDTISLRVVGGHIHESDRPDRNFVTLSGYKIGSGDIGPQFGGGSGGDGGAGSPGFAFGTPAAGGPDSSPPSEGEEEFTPLAPDTVGPK